MSRTLKVDSTETLAISFQHGILDSCGRSVHSINEGDPLHSLWSNATKNISHEVWEATTSHLAGSMGVDNGCILVVSSNVGGTNYRRKKIVVVAEWIELGGAHVKHCVAISIHNIISL